MIRFSGEVRLPISRSRALAELSDAAFLASCVPEVEILSASAEAATWRAPSPFRIVSTPIESTLTILWREPDSLRFALMNRLPGATLTVECDLAFSDSDAECDVAWNGEIVSRTGLLKIVPSAVLAQQCEAAIADLWRTVREKLSAGQDTGSNSI